MADKKQHNSILLSALCFAVAVLLAGVIGYFALQRPEDGIQGEVEVSQYRVSSKVPGRVLEIRVKEGDFVHKGDTLAILDIPDVEAKQQQAESLKEQAEAMELLAQKGARRQQIEAAFQTVQQAKAALEIAEKSYQRVENLFSEGVLSEQKRDEAKAQYQAAKAKVKAAKSQYDLAVEGAREEEKMAARAAVKRASGAVSEVGSYVNERVQVAQLDGEVSEIYPKVGELLGAGSPIMSVSLLNDIWGTFNVREDQLRGLKMGDKIEADVPAFSQKITFKVFNIKDLGSFAVWKAAKSNGEYDKKMFEVKARPLKTFDGLRPGMSLIWK